MTLDKGVVGRIMSFKKNVPGRENAHQQKVLQVEKYAIITGIAYKVMSLGKKVSQVQLISLVKSVT